MKRKQVFSLGAMFIVIACIAVLINAARFAHTVSGLYITQEVYHQIQEGMTMEEVRSVAGDPHGEHCFSGQIMWTYGVWNGFVPYSNPLVLSFDEHEKVCRISF